MIKTLRFRNLTILNMVAVFRNWLPIRGYACIRS